MPEIVAQEDITFTLLRKQLVAVPLMGSVIRCNITVHGPQLCAGTYCPIHLPSNHHMREWETVIRLDRHSLVERLCPHGTGHPDPDSVAFLSSPEAPHPVLRHQLERHGCDRCCDESAYAQLEHGMVAVTPVDAPMTGFATRQPAPAAVRRQIDYQELCGIVAEVAFNDYEFGVFVDGERPYLQLSYQEADVDTGDPADQKSRKWFLSPHMTRDEVVQTCLKAALTSLEHRCREHFLYRGRAIFAPHWDIDFLWENARPGNFRRREPIEFSR